MLAWTQITPDTDEAADWLRQELSRPEYGSELSPLTRIIRWFLEAFFSHTDSSFWTPRAETVLLLVFLAALCVLGIIAVLNRSSLKRKKSGRVFDGDDLSIADVKATLHEALTKQDWDNAFVWAFRLLVLRMDERQLLHDGPGVTALEAAQAAAAAAPHLAQEFISAAHDFDDIRYGEGVASQPQVRHLLDLLDRLEEVHL